MERLAFPQVHSGLHKPEEFVSSFRIKGALLWTCPLMTGLWTENKTPPTSNTPYLQHTLQSFPAHPAPNSSSQSNYVFWISWLCISGLLCSQNINSCKARQPLKRNVPACLQDLFSSSKPLPTSFLWHVFISRCNHNRTAIWEQKHSVIWAYSISHHLPFMFLSTDILSSPGIWDIFLYKYVSKSLTSSFCFLFEWVLFSC